MLMDTKYRHDVRKSVLLCEQTARILGTSADALASHELAIYAKRYMDYMGDTADAVHDFLVARQVRGVRVEIDDCPVAVQLSNILGIKVSVTLGGVWVRCGMHSQSVKTPYAVRRFIAKFDTGDYPDLEKEMES